jgi:hypothetical protein
MSLKHGLIDIDEPTLSAFCKGCRQRVKVSRNPEMKSGWECKGTPAGLLDHHILREIDPKTATAFCRGCNARVPVRPHRHGWGCVTALKRRQEQKRTLQGRLPRSSNTETNEERQIDLFIAGMQEERLKRPKDPSHLEPWDYPPDPHPSKWAGEIAKLIQEGKVPTLPANWRIGFDLEHETVTISRLTDHKSARDVPVRGNLEAALKEALFSANLPLWFRP